MIQEIQIDNFKSLIGFPIPLAKFTCLVGLNGAGKTTLLQAIDFLSQVMSGNIKEWLVQREWSASDLLCSFEKRKRIISFHVVLDLIDNDVICWEGKFNIVQLRCTSEKIYFGCADVNALVVEDKTYRLDVLHVMNGKYWVAQGAENPISFEYQGSILSQLKEANLGQHKQAIILLKKYFQEIKSLELLAPNLMRQRARTAEGIGIGGEKLSAFLSELSIDKKNILEKYLKNFAPDFESLDVLSLRGGWKKMLFFEHYKDNDIFMTTEARHINDGLLRQLAILAQTMTQHPLLLFDEIENGMNQELVGKLVRHLLDAPQQIIVTTHSPQILNFLPDDVAREGVILLYRTPQGITRARRYFDLPAPAEKLASLGPGEVYADTPLDEVVRSALEKDRDDEVISEETRDR
ncbi:MAG: AAA family ATPase [Magnetococcus sp. DMHC-1]|nr:AAA family ATPase [Magnetococcales bacterium]